MTKQDVNFLGYLIFGILAICIALHIKNLVASAEGSPDQCAQLDFIYARGSGQSLQANEEKHWSDAIRKKLDNTQISYHTYELGTETYNKSKYPAVAVGLNHPLTSFDAYIGDGQGFSYGSSVDAGSRELLGYLKDRHAHCPSTRFILGGYSQGAQVIGQAMEILPKELDEYIVFTGLFGDPRLDLPEGVATVHTDGIYAPACTSRDFSPWRRDIGNCTTSAGSLGFGSYYSDTTVMKQRSGLWCAAHDYICGSTNNLTDQSGHSTYKNADGAIDKAISEGVGHAIPYLSSEMQASLLSSQGQHDIVINENVHCDLNVEDPSYFAAEKSVQEIYNYVNSTNSRDRVVANVRYAEYEYPGGHYEGQDLINILQAGDDMWHTTFRPNTQIVIYVFLCNPPAPVATTALRSKVKIARQALTTTQETSPSSFMTYLFKPPESTVSCSSSTQVQCLTLTDQSGSTTFNSLAKPPSVSFRTTNYQGIINQPLHFDVRPYYDDSQIITTYDWDFDGNGAVDQTTASPTVDHAYLTTFDGNATVIAHRDDGVAATASTNVVVTPTAPEQSRGPAAPTRLTLTKISNTSLKASWELTDPNTSKWLILANNEPLGQMDSSGAYIILDGVDLSQSFSFRIAGVASDGAVGPWAAIGYDPQRGAVDEDAYNSPQAETARREKLAAEIDIAAQSTSDIPQKNDTSINQNTRNTTPSVMKHLSRVPSEDFWNSALILFAYFGIIVACAAVGVWRHIRKL